MAVNVLRKTPQVWHITKSDIFEIRVSQSEEKIWWKCPHADFTRVCDPLTCWQSEGVLERCFLKSGLTTFFTFCNFRNKVGMAIIFFFKMFKIWCRFQKWNKKIGKNYLFEIKFHLHQGPQIPKILTRIIVIGSQCVTKHR